MEAKAAGHASIGLFMFKRKGKTMKEIKIGIIGGGAAGMACAITAARAGAEVTIIEAGERMGQKILSTGNGKCNLGNMELNASQYHGSCAFLSDAFSKFGTKDTIAFFESLGLYVKEKNGYLYPQSEQASAVSDALRYEIAALGIKVITGFRATQVRKTGNEATADGIGSGSFIVSDGKRELMLDRMILTCGGKAMPKTGSDGSGWDIAQRLGHTIVPVVPALTNLKCKEQFFKAISGVRTDARVTLLGKSSLSYGGAGLDDKALASERGELQLTDQGISGIPVFQLSREAAYLLRKQKEVGVLIDFLPMFSDAELVEMAKKRMSLRNGRTVEEFFTGILPKKIMSLLLKLSGLKHMDQASNLTEQDITALLLSAKSFMVHAIGTGDFSNCQVCAGGVDCKEITDSMESKMVKRLYFAGEILDVDGRCGGYNLQWAWTSGYLAGMNAAR